MKKKRGGQRSLFRATAEQRIAQMADTLKKLQTGETRLMWEPTSEEIQAMGMSVDEKSAAILDQEAQRMRKLRSPNGLMKRDNAIDLVAGIHGIKPQKLADFVAGKRGASRGGRRRWPAGTTKRLG